MSTQTIDDSFIREFESAPRSAPADGKALIEAKQRLEEVTAEIAHQTQHLKRLGGVEATACAARLSALRRERAALMEKITAGRRRWLCERLASAQTTETMAAQIVMICRAEIERLTA